MHSKSNRLIEKKKKKKKKRGVGQEVSCFL